MNSDLNPSIINKVYALPSVAALLMVIYVLQGYIITNANPLLGISIILLIMHILIRRNMSLNIRNIDVLWLLFAASLIGGALLSINQVQGVKFGFNILILVLAMLLLSNVNGWQRFFMKCLWIFSFIHVMGTILAFIVPDMVSNFNRLILSPVEFELNQYFLYHYGGNPGITGQIGLNAWFISIFISVAFSFLLTSNKKKLLHGLFLLVGFFALLLANKRGLLVGNILAMLTVTWALGLVEKNIIKRTLTILVLVFIPVIISLVIFPEAQSVFNRLIHSENLLTGRGTIYKDLIYYFSSSPLFGVGTSSIVLLIGEAGHNVYLQVLAENGIWGLTIFLLSISLAFNRTLKLIKFLIKNEGSTGITQVIISLYIQVIFILYAFSGNPLYNYQFISIYLFILALEGSYKNFLISK